jgi:flagellar motor protein MotB
MSSKFSFFIAAGILSLSSIGCSGAWMTREEHERETAQLTEYKDALEAENAALKLKGADYDRMKAELEANGESAKFYADLAASLKKALTGAGVEANEVFVDPKTGTVNFASSLLFDLGSWNISVRGKQALKAFADTQRSNVFKIVGHTDRKPITREATIKALETKTNMELSCRRATAVMGELLRDGIRESQIASVEGHGTEATERNGVARCVEIFVVKGVQVAPTSFKTAKPAKK